MIGYFSNLNGLRKDTRSPALNQQKTTILSRVYPPSSSHAWRVRNTKFLISKFCRFSSFTQFYGSFSHATSVSAPYNTSLRRPTFSAAESSVLANLTFFLFFSLFLTRISKWTKNTKKERSWLGGWVGEGPEFGAMARNRGKIGNFRWRFFLKFYSKREISHCMFMFLEWKL